MTDEPVLPADDAAAVQFEDWVSYNAHMCALIRRFGAPAVVELATTWLNTIGHVIVSQEADHGA